MSGRPARAGEPQRPETCLVTGASGFIGGHVARRLAAEAVPVRALVRATSASSATDRLRGLGVELAVGDLTDAASMREAAQGCTSVVHCGALVSDWATVPEILAVNVEGTRNVVEAALAASLSRLVHVSSTDVYGHPDQRDVDETFTPARFGNWYAETKRRAEGVVRGADRVHGLATVIVRPATVYGPGSTEVIAEIARALCAGHMLLIDRGRPVAGLAYVDNVVDGILLALRRDGAPGQAFNLSDEVDVTWRQFTDDLAVRLGCRRARLSLPYPLAAAIGVGLEQGYRLARRATGLTSPALLSRQAVQVLGRDQRFSCARAREVLGWTPRVGYADGLAATVDWLRSGEAGL